MNPSIKNSTTFPQTVEMPEPLVVHPSISSDLANEMLRVASLFSKQPHLFEGETAVIRHECGCILAHVTGATYENCRGVHSAYSLGMANQRWPGHRDAFSDIFGRSMINMRDAQWAIARIEHFLRTGQ